MRITALAVLMLVVPNVLMAEDTKPAEEKFVNLFDGKTLDGWKVSECEVAVQDGAILLKGGNGWMRTDKKYADYVLEIEWKALDPKMWDSGIYIRATEPKAGQSWPSRNQINLRKGLEGNIKEIKEAVAASELIKPGEWNRFRITVVGKTASLEINGKPAWKTDRMKPATGYIGLQCEVPGGGQFLVRQVRISEK